jgi:hypothetical protein
MVPKGEYLSTYPVISTKDKCYTITTSSVMILAQQDKIRTLFELAAILRTFYDFFVLSSC